MRVTLVTLLAVTAVISGGCGAVHLVRAGTATQAAAGKKLFQAKCGACHTLADAGTTGTVGPNLDDAFLYVKEQGFKEQSIRDLIRGQIAYAESNPGTGTPTAPNPGMPANLVNGQDASDVAIYVAKCAGVKSCGV